MWRTDSFEKTLMLGKIEGRRGRGRQRMRWLASLTQWTWVWVGSGSWWWTGKPGVLQSMGSQRVRHDWATELYWTESSFTSLGLERCFLSGADDPQGQSGLCPQEEAWDWSWADNPQHVLPRLLFQWFGIPQVRKMAGTSNLFSPKKNFFKSLKLDQKHRKADDTREQNLTIFKLLS